MPKEIVIVGGGFAGINLIKSLSGNKHYHLTLVDKNNYNFFPPLLYQVATGFLEASNISYPFRKLLRHLPDTSFRLGEVIRVDTTSKLLILDNGSLPYDYLVFATGTETNYFGMENVRKNAIPMKTINDAIEMRNILLQRMELASISKDPALKKKLLTVVVAGAGPTGVEVAGMFAELWKNALKKDYPELKGAGAAIHLVDGSANVLSPMSEESQKDAFTALTRMGVKVGLNKKVEDFSDDKVIFADGEIIETKSVIWAAGVTCKTFDGLPVSVYGRGKRMIVDAFNELIEVPDVFALGDTCIQTTDADFPQGHPQLAQVAIQQAKNLAHNFKERSNKGIKRPFKYTDKGSMAVIGRNKAVADLATPKAHFNGFIAWGMWVFVHLLSLINYRNRIKTLYNWTTTYFTMDQSLRFIIRPDKDIEANTGNNT